MNEVFFLQSFYQNAGSKGESCVKRPNFVQKKIFIYSIRTGVETLQRKSSLKAFTTTILRIFTNHFLQLLITIYEPFSSIINVIYESLSSTNDYNLLIIFINDWYELWIIISRWLIMTYKSFSLMINYNLQIIFFNGWLRFANDFLQWLNTIWDKYVVKCFPRR